MAFLSEFCYFLSFCFKTRIAVNAYSSQSRVPLLDTLSDGFGSVVGVGDCCLSFLCIPSI